MSRSLDPLNYAHRTPYRSGSIRLSLHSSHGSRRSDQRTFEKYASAGHGNTIRHMRRTLGFMIYLAKASRFVDQEAAYRSFLHLRIFFLLTILLPQKRIEDSERETGWARTLYIPAPLRMEDTITVPNLLVTFTKGMTIQSCVCNTLA